MAYNLQTSQTSFKGGKNILASEHVQFVEAGATLKGGQGLLQCGQAIARATSDGKWVKFAAANVANYDDFGILTSMLTLQFTTLLLVKSLFAGQCMTPS
ncbi:hypothetical protein E4O93_16470 [Diaphorobacter sp. DS2]|nr:hypothetical protein E4O93_16470 [Diaphorobacter sp. DS2]